MAGFFDTLFSGGAEREAAERNRQLTSQYGTDAQGYLKTGYDTGVGNINQAIGAYQPLSDLAQGYNKGGALYLDALGVNGPEGNARATGSFQAGPGYNFATNNAEQAIARRRANSVMYDSGNTDLDLNTAIQGLANQEYGNWQTRLQGAGQTGVGLTGAAAQGQATGYGNLANLAGKYAGDQTGVVGNQLSSNVNSSNLQAQGEASGARNLLGAGMSLASLAMGGMGGGLGSSLSSGASSLFGSGMGQQWQQNNPGAWGSSYYGPVR